jgi:hypothetical protein
MNRAKLYAYYLEKAAHINCMIDLINKLPLCSEKSPDKIIRFRVTYRTINDCYVGDLLAIPRRFNTESLIIDAVAGDDAYPLYRVPLGDTNEGRICLKFRDIVSWEEFQDINLPLYITKQIKTFYLEKAFKRVQKGN